MGNCLKSKQSEVNLLLSKGTEESVQSVSYPPRFNDVQRVRQTSAHRSRSEWNEKRKPRVTPAPVAEVRCLQVEDKMKTSGIRIPKDSENRLQHYKVQNETGNDQNQIPSLQTYTVKIDSRSLSKEEGKNREEETVISIGSGKQKILKKANGQVLPSSSKQTEDEMWKYDERINLTDSNKDQRYIKNRKDGDKLNGSVNEGPQIEKLDQESGSKARYEKEIKELKTQVKKLKAENDQLRNRNREDEDKRKRSVNEGSHIENLDQESGSKDQNAKEIKELKAQAKELIVEKEKLLHRLSEIGAMKLTDNNPNVTDLSDPYRPEKLMDQFFELYDNEWTDAYEHLTKTQGKRIEQSVSLLLQFLKKTYDVCLYSTTKRAKRLRKAMFSYAGVSEEDSSQLELQKIEQKMWKYRMKKSLCNIALVEKEVRKSLHEQLAKLGQETSESVSVYIESCVRICWYMCSRNPPMHLDFGETEESSNTNNNTPANKYFNKSKFVAYTKAGEYIDYVVWPAVFQHDGGLIMRKGVAQGSSVITNTLVDA